MKFILKVTPQIHPSIRHQIEDILKVEGYSIIGGGQTINVSQEDSFSDISFEGDGN